MHVIEQSPSLMQQMRCRDALPANPMGDVDLGANFPMAGVAGYLGVPPTGAAAAGSGNALRPMTAEAGAQAPQVHGPPAIAQETADYTLPDIPLDPGAHNSLSASYRRSLKQLIFPVQGSLSILDLINQITNSAGLISVISPFLWSQLFSRLIPASSRIECTIAHASQYLQPPVIAKQSIVILSLGVVNFKRGARYNLVCKILLHAKSSPTYERQESWSNCSRL